MKPIIRATNVSKQYQLGGRQNSLPTLRDTIADAVKAPLKRSKTNGTGGTINALQNVSFEIAAGEVLGIIGRNGAGKSTLLKVLSRITEPSSGRIEMYGRVASLLEVGTGFHPELSGRENIYLNGAIMGMTRVEIRRKFDEIVAFAEVETFIDTPVKHFSSGMYLRLAFAVAAHLDPEILLVDEVLAVGDARFQRKCL
ncbi:MAG TPA: ABC transporter ATP-binding protein, partial [Pyrinomonadaceae bacterium]|nr:ABC transporter ATP-binding protein [Pyrinomonadaceae bacterium]